MLRFRHTLWMSLLALALTMGLNACGTDSDAKKDDAKTEDADKKAEKKIEPPAPICPQVAVVNGLDILHDYGRETPAPNQLVAGAKLLGIDGQCEYPDEGGIDVTFNLNMIAKRGPKLGGSHDSFPLFVAVLDPNGAILNKNQFTADIKFSSDEDYVNHSEAMHVFIPLAKDKQSTGPYYRVLSGFQLTPEQEAEAQKQQN